VAGRFQIEGFRILSSAAAVGLALACAGCSAGAIADLPVVGMPQGVPARPADPGEFPAVHDIPAPRQQQPLDPATQSRIEHELEAARDRQTRAGRN